MESVAQLYILSVPLDSMFVAPAPTFPLSSTIRFATAYLTSVFGHLMSLSGLSGDRGPGPVLRLASPAVAGPTLCGWRCLTRSGKGRGPPPSVVQWPSCLFTQLFLLFPLTPSLEFRQKHSWLHSSLPLHVFCIKLSSLNMVPSAFIIHEFSPSFKLSHCASYFTSPF